MRIVWSDVTVADPYLYYIIYVKMLSLLALNVQSFNMFYSKSYQSFLLLSLLEVLPIPNSVQNIPTPITLFYVLTCIMHAITS